MIVKSNLSFLQKAGHRRPDEGARAVVDGGKVPLGCIGLCGEHRKHGGYHVRAHGKGRTLALRMGTNHYQTPVGTGVPDGPDPGIGGCRRKKDAGEHRRPLRDLI